MFNFFTYLPFLISLPILGIIILLFIPNKQQNLQKTVGLVTSLLTFIYSLFFFIYFDISTPKFQFVVPFFSVPYSNIHTYVGIDGISLFFILLTTFLVPICLLDSWDSIKIYIK